MRLLSLVLILSLSITAYAQTDTPSNTPTRTPTPTFSPTSTGTPTATPTDTPTPTKTPTNTRPGRPTGGGSLDTLGQAFPYLIDATPQPTPLAEEFVTHASNLPLSTPKWLVSSTRRLLAYYEVESATYTTTPAPAMSVWLRSPETGEPHKIATYDLDSVQNGTERGLLDIDLLIHQQPFLLTFDAATGLTEPALSLYLTQSRETR